MSHPTHIPADVKVRPAHELITLTGFLGRDPERKTTRTQTLLLTEGVRYGDDDFGFTLPPREIQTGGRDFVVLSLAVHERVAGRWGTRWHRLVAWDVDRGARHAAVICRKGDKIEVKGYRDTFTYERDGVTHTVEQIVVTDMKPLKIKAPEIP